MSGIRSILQEFVGKVATIRLQNKVSMKENRGPSPAPPMFRDKHASTKFGRFCGNNKTNVPKVFHDLSKRSKDTNFIDISCKLSQLEVEDPHKVCKLTIRYTTKAYFSNDLEYYVSPTAEETDCDNEAKSEDKNDEEEIVNIRDEKVYPQHELELAQFWKKMFPIPSTCIYPMIITRGITSRVLILNLFPPYQFGLEFPFDPGSSLLTMYNLVCMRVHLDNIQNNLFACSQEFADAQARSDLTKSLVGECKIKVGTESNIVSALNEDNSNPIDNLEVPSEMFELPFNVEHEKLEHMDTYLSVICLEPLPIPTKIVVGDDFATEAIDGVTSY
ncbi:hypothetical protein RDI58_024514 [Solanum bulbocastanum]|uniref:Uncharacterized protein n=1 Tax=Solanum bulbocastanum TaxID=147425 RepID=A0AAN8T3F7_SOLBU